MKHLIALLLVPLMGCGNPTYTVSTPDVVLPPGHVVHIDGEALRLFGADACPQNLFSDAAAGEANSQCIVLSKDKQEVMLRVVSASGVTREAWQVSRTSFPGPWGIPVDQTYLTRPTEPK